MQGRNFIGRGPDAAALEQFSGKPAVEPIRVYVGVESAPTAEERARSAVQELDRTEALAREVLVVMGTTGTGWIEPQSGDPLEYLWNGDSAEVTIQYSYLPSWISFLVDKQRAEDAGRPCSPPSASAGRSCRRTRDRGCRLRPQPRLVRPAGGVRGRGRSHSQTNGAVFIGTPTTRPSGEASRRPRPRQPRVAA